MSLQTLRLSTIRAVVTTAAASAGLAGGLASERALATPFRDITAEAGITFRHSNGAAGEKLLPETMGGGVAFLDYDRDGDEDLLFVDSGSFPRADGRPPAAPFSTLLVLYANDGRGRFTDVTRQVGLERLMSMGAATGQGSYGQGIAVGDYDGDGWLDLYVTAVGPNVLLRNREGRFEEVTTEAGVGGGDAWSSAATFFDADADGDLDLVVGNYLEWSLALDRDVKRRESRTVTFANETSEKGERGLIYGLPGDYRGAAPLLFQNRGDGTFVERAREAGLVVVDPATNEPLTKAMAVAPIDLEMDGRIDLLVANDTTRNMLFHNLGPATRGGAPRFEEVGELFGLAYDSNGATTGAMGVDWGHLDADATLAVLVGNFAGEASSAHLAQGHPTLFADEALGVGIAGATQKPLAFGVLLLDVNLDGRLDLLQVNGHVESDIEKIDPTQRYAQPPQLFWNRGSAAQGSRKRLPRLVLAEESEVGDLYRPIVGRGAAYADIDGDGDLDLVLTQAGGRPRLLRNDQRSGHHWLRVRLQDRPPNVHAYGARIELTAGGVVQRREIAPARGYLSQVEAVATFGLGEGKVVERLVVTWLDGGREDFLVETAATVDRLVVLERGRGRAVSMAD
jgi:hypothetical protein